VRKKAAKAAIILYIKAGIIVYIKAGIIGYFSQLPDKSHCLHTIDPLSGIARLPDLDAHW